VAAKRPGDEEPAPPAGPVADAAHLVAVPAVVADHLYALVRDMLGDGGQKSVAVKTSKLRLILAGRRMSRCSLRANSGSGCGSGGRRYWLVRAWRPEAFWLLPEGASACAIVCARLEGRLAWVSFHPFRKPCRAQKPGA